MMLSKFVYFSFLALLYVDSLAFVPNNSTLIGPHRVTRPPVPTSKVPVKSDPLPYNCYIDEKFMNEVQILYTIGVRERTHFKITGPDESFDFNFFHPVTDGDPVKEILTGRLDYYDNDNDDYVIYNGTVPLNFTDYSDNSTDISGGQQGPVVSASFDPDLQKFHFLLMNNGFRHYQVDWEGYIRRNQDEEPFGGHKFSENLLNIDGNYHCHFNVRRNSSVCVSIKNQKITVGYYEENKPKPKIENRFSLPSYLSFDDFYSYSDYNGTDFILLHHRGQWIYRINYQEYLTNQNMFFKVFHLKLPAGDFEFSSFKYADEFGLVTEYLFENDEFRYFYSLFSEISGLKTYCIHNKMINGSVMIMGRERIEQTPSTAELFQNFVGLPAKDNYELPTMLRILFYCTLIYLAIFLGTQLIPVRKVRLSKELRRLEREVQRLAPVIEVIIAKVHVFMENLKQEMKQE